jgi:hypothetical protein
MPKTIEMEISGSLLSLEKDMDNSMESRRGLELVFQDISVKLNSIIDLSNAGKLEIESDFIEKIKDYLRHLIKKEMEGEPISDGEIQLTKGMIRESLEQLRITSCE